MTTMFQGRQPGEAPQMQPDGAATCGIAPEGQVVLSQPFLLQPGHCYTFLGQSLPTVTEVTHRGEREWNIFSRLLKDRIVFIGTEIDASSPTR